MMSEADREPLRYLTAPLREVAGRHLHPDETILTAIYVGPFGRLTRYKWWWFTWVSQKELPAKAFILTPERALILEDPTHPAASTAEHDYLVASCSLNRIILFEMRSHLLDCALTLVLAATNGPEHVTIEYNGVSENTFLAALACMRAVVDRQPLPPYTRADETYFRGRAATHRDWHAVLAELEMRHENAVSRYLVPGEQVHEWLLVPLIDESKWWQRLGIGAHEQPPAVLVRTYRQILLVKENKRVVRGQVAYGSDAWLMPLERLRTASIVSGKRGPEVQLCLEHAGVTEVVSFPILADLAERALALVASTLPR